MGLEACTNLVAVIGRLRMPEIYISIPCCNRPTIGVKSRRQAASGKKESVPVVGAEQDVRV